MIIGTDLKLPLGLEKAHLSLVDENVQLLIEAGSIDRKPSKPVRFDPCTYINPHHHHPHHHHHHHHMMWIPTLFVCATYRFKYGSGWNLRITQKSFQRNLGSPNPSKKDPQSLKQQGSLNYLFWVDQTMQIWVVVSNIFYFHPYLGK